MKEPLFFNKYFPNEEVLYFNYKWVSGLIAPMDANTRAGKGLISVRLHHTNVVWVYEKGEKYAGWVNLSEVKFKDPVMKLLYGS